MNSTTFFTVLAMLCCSLTTQAQSPRNFSISGTIKDKGAGETLSGASISFAGKPGIGVVTNTYGFYSISLPRGSYIMLISFAGYTTDSVAVELSQNQVLNHSMGEERGSLQDVTVSAKKAGSVLKTPPGVQRLSMTDIKDVPVLLGEKDVLKTIQLLPGIKSAGDGQTGFYVRGGAADQNLILLDEAPVYNASHLLGFFSVFNSDAIKDISLYKGGMPANYGGRLASVEDVKMKDGNDQKITGSGGIGLIASRLNLEGPIVKDKGSFIVSGRRTYIDLFTGLSSDTTIKRSKLYFYDVNVKANYRLNANNRLFLSGYLGNDVMHIHAGPGLDWGNQTATLRWNHLFSKRLFSNTSLIFSNYNYNSQYTNVNTDVRVTSSITDFQVKQDFNSYINPKNRIDFGFNAIYHITQPGRATSGADSKFNNITLDKKYAWENAAYVSHEWNPDTRLKLTYGLRLSELTVLGPGGKGDVKNYWNPEPRAAVSYQLDDISSVKAAFDRTVQNIHLLNNSSSYSPTNVYLPTSAVVQPEIADQVSGGYYRYFNNKDYEFSSEIYYKWMQNQIDYRNGANLVGNNDVEADLLFGKGRAYGWENYIRKRTGRLTGWVSYTLSKTERQISGINNGSWYPALQDQTHNLAIVAVYKYSNKWTFSGTFTYHTGNATTWPSAKYAVDGAPIYYYNQRNGDRMPAYHRLDLGATLQLKKKEHFSSELNFSLYNAYGQYNPYTISFQKDPNSPDLTQVKLTSLFRWIPSVTYNFKF